MASLPPTAISARRTCSSSAPDARPALTTTTGMPRPSLLSELWAFMRVRKKWWLLPLVVVMLAVGMLIAFAQGSALAPFIYTIF